MYVVIRNQEDIVKHYGIDSQLGICQEECAELIQAISKIQRFGHKCNENDIMNWLKLKDGIVEEMADVIVCLDQLQFIFAITDGELEDKANEKINRQFARMMTEKTESKDRLPFE